MGPLVELRPGWVGLRLADVASCPTQLALPGARCCVFVACDARGCEQGVLVEFGRRLLGVGAVYVCAWGPECERVEAGVDVAVVEAGVERGDDDCVMTTSHEGESLEEALWFFEHCAWPASAYAGAEGVRLVVSVGGLEVLDAACRTRTDEGQA